MACSTCFNDYIAKCNDTLTVYAKLEPETEYTWVIEDKFGHKYQGAVVTDINGYLQIPVADLPAGLLTEYSGNFKLHIETSTCERVRFLIAKEYDCIDFTVKGGNYEKANLGCDFQCVTEVMPPE